MASAYGSMFQPPDEVSPSAAVLNRTAQYAGPPLPEAPQFKGAPPLNPIEGIGLMLRSGVAGYRGEGNPTDSILKSRNAPYEAQNQAEQQNFENKMKLHQEGRASAAEQRTATKFDREERAHKQFEWLIANPQMMPGPATQDPTTGEPIPGAPVENKAQRNRLLAQIFADLGEKERAVKMLDNNPLSQADLEDLGIPTKQAKVLQGRPLDDQILKFIDYQKTARTPYQDVQLAAKKQGLEPGSPEYQQFVNNAQAAQAGNMAESRATALAPIQLQVQAAQAGVRGEQVRKNIDYRLQATGDAPITAQKAPLWVDATGNNIEAKKIVGKKPSEIFNSEEHAGAVPLMNSQENNTLRSAKSLIGIREQIVPLLPEILKSFGNQKLTDIMSVQGNKLNIKLRGVAGDPKVARFNALLTDFLVETPLAMGMVAGREGPELLKRYESGMPGVGSTVQSALAAMDANIDSVRTRWLYRNIDITGSRGAGPTPTKPTPAGPTPGGAETPLQRRNRLLGGG